MRVNSAGHTEVDKRVAWEGGTKSEAMAVRNFVPRRVPEDRIRADSGIAPVLEKYCTGNALRSNPHVLHLCYNGTTLENHGNCTGTTLVLH